MKQKLTLDKLEKLMGDHMVAWYFTGSKTEKPYYRVTAENFKDFILKVQVDLFNPPLINKV